MKQVAGMTLGGIAAIGGAGAAAVLAFVLYSGDRPASSPSDVPVADTLQAKPTASAPNTESVDASAEKDSAEPQTPPGFDIVRVDPDGAALIAGTATAGAGVLVLLDGQEQDSVEADGGGRFVSFLTLPPDDLPRVLSLRLVTEEGTLDSEDRVIIAPRSVAPPQDAASVGPSERQGVISQQGAEANGAASLSAQLTEAPTDSGADVTARRDTSTTPEGAEESQPTSEAQDERLASAGTRAKTAAAADPATDTSDRPAPETAGPSDASDRAEGTGRPQTGSGVADIDVAAETQADETSAQSALAGADRQATAPSADSAAGATPIASPPGSSDAKLQTNIATRPATAKNNDSVETRDVAAATGAAAPPKQPQTTAASPQRDTPPTSTPQTTTPQATTPQAPTVILANREGVRVLQTPSDRAMQAVALDAISYSDEGDVALSGRGAGQGFVRVYLDNTPVTTSRIAQDGNWRAELPDVDSGVYTLRIDEVDDDGTVISRVESPFKRESPATLAAGLGTGAQQAQALTVQPGDTLWAIATDRYGDGFLYVRVFRANADRIRNPDLIYPGQIFALPTDDAGDASPAAAPE